MTNKGKYPMYALVIVAGAAIALWAGLPWAFLLLLMCPVMMFFMMSSMGGMSSGQRGSDSSGDKDAAKRSNASAPDGSHERIN